MSHKGAEREGRGSGNRRAAELDVDLRRADAHAVGGIRMRLMNVWADGVQQCLSAPPPPPPPRLKRGSVDRPTENRPQSAQGPGGGGLLC